MKNLIKLLFFSLIFGPIYLAAQATSGPALPNAEETEQHASDNSGEREPVGDPAPPGGGSGGGDAAVMVKIYHDWPWDGTTAPHKVTNTNYDLRWKDTLDAAYYIVTIKGSADLNKVLYTEGSSRKSANIAIGDLNLDSDQTYTLQVTATGNVNKKTPVSLTSKFKVSDKGDVAKIISAVKAMPEYATADNINKLLLKARGLEINGYTLDAAKYFKQYIESDQDDITLRNLRDQFRKRNKLFSVN